MIQRFIETLTYNKINFDDIKVILDIGSRDVNESIQLGIFFPKARIFAFEADPISAEECRKNLVKKQVSRPDITDRITVVHAAVCDKDKRVKFYPLDRENCKSTNYGVASMLKFKPGLNGSFLNDEWIQKEIEVDGIRIDTWCEQNSIDQVDLIWMDVQGTELYALYGMEKILPTVKAICTEAGLIPYYEGHTMKRDITEFLAGYGIKEVRVGKWSTAHKFECDVIYMHEDFIARDSFFLCV